MSLYRKLRKAAHGGATALKKNWDSGRNKIKLDPVAAQKLKNAMKNMGKNAAESFSKLKEKTTTTAEGAVTQGKKNLQSATTTARSNVHGVTTAARTGLHDATSDAKGLATKVATGVKTAWDKGRGKGPKESVGGGGTGASGAAMGSDSGVKEDSKIGDKGKQFDTGKKKRLSSSKDKLKARKMKV